MNKDIEETHNSVSLRELGASNLFSNEKEKDVQPSGALLC
jgi:hypothetical protein